MKKLLQLFLAILLLLSGCAKEENNEEIQANFNEYIDEIVKEELEADFLTYHYMLVDGESFGVEKPEVTLGDLDLESTLESIESCKEELEELHKFDSKRLTKQQQYIYKCLEIQLENNIKYGNHLNFDFCFGDNKINDNLITNFTEYRMETEEDIQDFIVLLNDTGRYIDEGIERTKQLAQKGYIQNELIKESVIKSCTKFMTSEEIEKYFSLQLDKIEISNQKKKDYEQQVKAGVDIMQAAYGRIVECYKSLEKSKYQGSLAEVENGKEYFETLIQIYSGTSRSAKQWINLLENEIEDVIIEWVMVMYYGDSDVFSELETIKMPYDNAQEMVEYLEKCLDEYPSIDQVEYQVSYLDASVANELTSAYYVVPPLDAPNKNTIKVNPRNTDYFELFSTLAHEGFPGHLYQNNYAIQNNQPIIYQFIDNLGASEGWAEVAGQESYRLAGIGSSDLQDYMRLYNYLDRILLEYIDIRVNYSNWGVVEIKNYLDELGLSSDIAFNLYDAAIQYPGVFAPYALGTYEVLRLRDYAYEELEEDFDIKEFHRVFLDTGLVHFDVIEEQVKEYVKGK